MSNRKPLSRGQWIAISAIIVPAVLVIIGWFMVSPSKPKQSQNAVTGSGSGAANSVIGNQNIIGNKNVAGNSVSGNQNITGNNNTALPSPQPQSKPAAKQRLKKNTSQKSQSTGKGSQNVTGNNVSGNGNVTGNGNQVDQSVGPTVRAYAPNGIANAAPNLGTQTVNNFAPPARTIPSVKRTECISLLSGMRGRVSVNALSGDSEAFRYAKEWYDLFVASGWDMKDSQVMSIVFFSAPPQGIQVNFHGESLTPGQAIVPSPLFLLPLEKCLNGLGIERRGNPHPEMPDHEILFIVGMKPD